MTGFVKPHASFQRWLAFSGDSFRRYGGALALALTWGVRLHSLTTTTCRTLTLHRACLLRPSVDAYLVPRKPALFVWFQVWSTVAPAPAAARTAARAAAGKLPGLGAAVAGNYHPPTRSMTLYQWLYMLDTAMLFDTSVSQLQAVLAFVWAQLRRADGPPDVLDFTSFLEAWCRLAAFRTPVAVVRTREPSGEDDDGNPVLRLPRHPAQDEEDVQQLVASVNVVPPLAQLLALAAETYCARLVAADLDGHAGALLSSCKASSFAEVMDL